MGSSRAGILLDSYAIVATRNFYIPHFRAPQAIAYWATCYSWDLSGMVGSGKARDFLGYDNVVPSAKCYCDEDYILRRMDGLEGQFLRPLKEAFSNVNGACASSGVALHRRGPGNTVLSPSVLLEEPEDGSIVCFDTIGFVVFDTSMDTQIDPASVVTASGGGVLINQRWRNDDNIDFDVDVLVQYPLITYDVHESRARGIKNHARLDGNQDPPGTNAHGPNRDDYIWRTFCYGGPTPVSPQAPSSPPYPTPAPGNTTTFTLPLQSGSDVDVDVDIELHDVTGFTPQSTSGSTTVPAGSNSDVSFDFDIPEDAEPGDQGTFTLLIIMDAAGELDSLQSAESFVIGQHVDSWLAFPPVLAPGEDAPVDVIVENRSGEDVFLSSLSLANSLGWGVTATTPDTASLAPFEMTMLSFELSVPGAAPAGTENTFQLTGFSDGVMLNQDLGTSTVGLPLVVTSQPAVDFVPGNLDAVVPFSIENRSGVPHNVSYDVLSSSSFPLVVNAPPTIPPDSTVAGSIQVSVPAVGGLIGQSDLLTVRVFDPSSYQVETTFVVPIEHPLEVVSEVPSLHTGHATDTVFPWPTAIRNRSDEPLDTMLFLDPGGLLVGPPTNLFLPPEAEVPLEFQVTVFPDFPAGVYPRNLIASATNANTMEPYGDIIETGEFEVTEPVLVNTLFREISGAPGEVVDFRSEIRNVTNDLTFSCTIEWTDSRGWLVPPLTEEYELLPGAFDTVSVSVAIPVAFERAAADSDSVAITVPLTYATGTPSAATGFLLIRVVDEVTVGVDDSGPEGLTTRLYGASPNPFYPATEVRFALAEAGLVRLTVHDVIGRRVRTLIDHRMEAGFQAVTWDGRRDGKPRVASGVYFLRLETSGMIVTRKVILTR